MDGPNYIALAVPFFFALIGVELLVARAKRARVYRLNDAVTDLSCGIGSQIVLLFWGAGQLAIYTAVYEHRVVTLPAWGAWLFAFVAVDFVYYWWHRWSHEVNFLWAAHVVHHQSEDYNLAVALRQAIVTSWTILPFHLPLALLGVPTIVFATIYSFSTLYQFWIHTQLVGKIRGPADWILNLPSHHRVHHAINPEYLDKNYGATLIVWDRLFGTYEEEVARPVYGITKPLASFNPIWAQIHYWVELVEMSRRARGVDKLLVWVRSPAWHPPDAAAERDAEAAAAPPIADRAKFDPPLSGRTAMYVLAHYVLLVVAVFFLMLYQGALPMAVLALGGVAIVGTTLSIGAFLEHRRWGAVAEIARLAIVAGAVVAWLRG